MSVEWLDLSELKHITGEITQVGFVSDPGFFIATVDCDPYGEVVAITPEHLKDAMPEQFRDGLTSGLFDLDLDDGMPEEFQMNPVERRIGTVTHAFAKLVEEATAKAVAAE